MRIRFLKAVHGTTPVLMGSSRGGSFGAGSPAQSIVAFLCSPIVLMGLALAFLVAWALSVGDVGSLGVAGGLFAMGPTALEEKEQEITAKSEKLSEVFESAGSDFDFGKKDVLRLLGVSDSAAAVAKVREWNAELADLAKKKKDLVDLTEIQQRLKERTTTPINLLPHPDGGNGNGNGNGKKERRSFGENIVSHERFKEYKRTKTPTTWEDENFGLAELKANFVTTAGWTPESTRVPGLLVEGRTRPIQLLDIIPSAQTEMATVKYMEETTRTHAAAERPEAAAYAEATFVVEEKSSDVRSIGDSIPVSDEQLQDVSGTRSYLDQRLLYGCRQRVDGQTLIGNGTAPNLRGIKNVVGINTQAKSTDPIPDAVFKAMRVIRVTGRAFPNAVVFHPTDWEKVRLSRTNDGIYIWGSPSEAGPDRIWGLQVVQCDADAAGSAYVGDFNFCALFERRGMEVEVGYINDQFTKGMRTIRAGLRVAFAVYRPTAFTQVTGL